MQVDYTNVCMRKSMGIVPRVTASLLLKPRGRMRYNTSIYGCDADQSLNLNFVQCPTTTYDNDLCTAYIYCRLPTRYNSIWCQVHLYSRRRYVLCMYDTKKHQAIHLMQSYPCPAQYKASRYGTTTYYTPASIPPDYPQKAGDV